MNSALRSASLAAGPLLTALTLSMGAAAATLTPSAFAYGGGTVTQEHDPQGTPQVHASWNPHRPGASSHAPVEFHVSFFGHGDGCPAPASDGPTAPLPLIVARRAQDLTGISALSHDTLSWTPAGNLAACRQAASDVPGPSFVEVDQRPSGGIGLFTYAGNGAGFSGHPFWRPFNKDGQNGKGANASIEGTFVAWTFAWRGGRAVIPWGGNAPANSASLRVMIRSTQSVPTIVTTASRSSASPTQVKQQFAISFINPECLRMLPGMPTCQIRYMFHSALARGADTHWLGEGWATHAHLLLDPAQGGLPVYYGPLKAQDQPTTDADAAEFTLWRSRGAETQIKSFQGETFAAEISFHEFLDGLRLIAARLSAIGVSKVHDRDLARLFGPGWADPKTWRVADVNIGQELHTTELRQATQIGGSVTRLDVLSLPQ